MDCQTARLMLEFSRPNSVELEPPDLRAVEAHLAACPQCALATKQQRGLDEQIGQAMRKLDVPDRLRHRLLAGLAKDRVAAQKWRWRVAASGGIALAASLLLVVGGWVAYVRATLPPLKLQEIAATSVQDDQVIPSPETIEAEYRQRGVEMKAPTSLNYAFLAFHGMGTLESKQVPCFVFIRDNAEANIHAHAKVYAVSDQEFNLKNVPANYQSEPGYKYKVEWYREPGSHFGFVIVYTGENLDWLRPSADDGEK